MLKLIRYIKFLLVATLEIKHISNISNVSLIKENFPLDIFSFCEKICPLESVTYNQKLF